MTYPAVTTEFSRLWLIDSQKADVLLKRMLSDKLDTIRVDMNGFMDSLAKFPTRPTDVEPRWVREYDYPDRLTCTLSGTSPRYLTVTGNMFGASPTLEAMSRIIRVRSTLEYVDPTTGTGYQVEVSALDGTNPIMTVVAVNGGSIPSNASSMVWTVLPAHHGDADAYTWNTWLNRELDSTVTQVFKESYSIEDTRATMKPVVIGDEIEHQVDAILGKLKRDIAKALISSQPVLSNGVPQSMLQTQRPKLSGLFWQIANMFGSGKTWENAQLWKNIGNATLDIEHVNQMCAALTDAGADLTTGKWELWTTHQVGRQIEDWGLEERQMTSGETTYGYNVSKIRTKEGIDLPVHRERLFPPGRLVIANMNNLQWDYLSGHEIKRKTLPADADYQHWAIRCQVVGLAIRKGMQSVAGAYGIAES